MTDLHTDLYANEPTPEEGERPDALRVAPADEGAACDEGAAILRDRIAARQWASAPGVASGDQPLRDPEAKYVAEVGDGYRVYLFPSDVDGGEPRVVRKTLVDGSWRSAGEPA